MSTPTPRTDAAWSATFDSEQISAGRTARALRECSQRLETELAELTAERDQLRAEVERLRSDRDCEKRIRKDAEELREDAIERAERAERAEAASCREILCTKSPKASSPNRRKSATATGLMLYDH